MGGGGLKLSARMIIRASANDTLYVVLFLFLFLFFSSTDM